MDFRTFISEEKGSTAVMAFGRYNPPTIGHEKLIKKVHDTAKEHNGEAHIIASHSENTKKDPLPQSKKIGYLKKVAPKGVNVSGSSSEHPSIFHQASKLHAAGHKHLVVVAGSDRVDEYHKALNKYNNVAGKHGHYNFKSIKVVSAGQRDPDAEGAEGMSASKARAHAVAGEHEKFKSALPKALHPHANEIAKHIRTASESVEEATNTFIKYGESEGVPQDADIKSRPGTQPAKYHTGLAPATKAARDAQFKKQTKMDSRDPAAYKPAPGDMTSTTKPSKYTAAFKRKFGENQVPVLLISKQKFLGEETQIEYDTIVTKSFDICPSAVREFNKHIEDANAGMLFMFYPLTLDVSPLVKQRELLKAAIEATDGYLTVEKIAVANKRATPNMIVDFNYFVRRAVQSLELLGVLSDHMEYIQGHIDTVAALANPAVKQPLPNASVYESYRIDEAAETGLAAKAKKSGVSLDTLRKVYKRGVAAWRTGHRPGTNPQQWGMARVNSYIMKGKGTYHGADKDLREEDEAKGDTLTEEDINEMVEELTWEDIIDLYKDDELVDDEDEDLSEALTAQARLKKRQTFARFRGRRGIAKTMKLRRASDMNTLQRRAKLAARRAIYKRFLKGRDKSQLSASEKDRIEQQVARLKVIQTTLAQRMVPKIRSIEQKRLASYRTRKK